MLSSPVLNTLAIAAAIGIGIWLWSDMKRQRRWREEKQAKIDTLQRRIDAKEADKKDISK